MRKDWTISAALHVAVIVFGLITFASTRPRATDAPEFIPVNIVSNTETSQITPGVKNAHKAAEKPKPLADAVGDPKPIKQLAPKVSDKPEITTDAAAPEHKPEPKKKPKTPEFKPDQIAEELKKDEAKKPPPKPEDRPRKDARPSPKFDASQVAALLDKRDPQRQLATAETLTGQASLGAPTGHAATLSQSELGALRAKLISLWNPPAAVSAHPDQYVVTVRVRLSRDHRLAGPPIVITSGEGALFEATRDSAVRAVVQAQPYDMLSLSTYDQWKEMDINFDPREVFGG